MNKSTKRETGVCPVCNGTKRVPVTPEQQSYAKICVGYDPADNTFNCTNCGGQYMSCAPTGQVFLNKEGVPCTHEYVGTRLGNCYHGYCCKHCADSYTIDSGD